MAGNFVFPGGTLDASDGDATAWQAHVDLDADGISMLLGGDLSAGDAMAYGVAAIRETFEEAGVLLASSKHLTTSSLEVLCTSRRLRGRSSGWFLKQASSDGWVLALSSLSRWARWITPEKMRFRYDTRFFVAGMPRGQVCRPDSGETAGGLWTSPQKALAANLAGEIALSPPTLVVLNELRAFAGLEDLAEAVQDRPWGPALLPRLVPLKNAAVIIEPWDPEYGCDRIHLDYARLEKSLLPAGAPFSRLWQHAGIWRPVRADMSVAGMNPRN